MYPKAKLRRNVIGAAFASLLVVFALALALSAPASAEPEAPSADIINGTIVPNVPSEWPYMVAVLAGTDLYWDQYCGGTLISPTLVITAAHCVDFDVPTHVLVGQKKLEGTGGQLIAVSQRVAHPLFDYDTLYADVAILKLATPASVGAPIELSNGLTDPPTGASVDIAGWGNTCTNDYCYPYDLYETSVNVASNSSCLAVYEYGIFPSNLCASYFAGFNSRDTCQGDSGGPLVYNHPTEGPLLAGITSWGAGCAQSPYPGVYTRVSSWAGWASSFAGPAIVGASDTVDFGSHAVGAAPATKTFVLNSEGLSAVDVDSVDLVGGSDFSITRNTCAGTIAVGASCEVDVQFSGASVGSYSSKLVVESDSAFSSTQVIPVFAALTAPPPPPPPPPTPFTPPAVSLSLKQSGRAKLTRGGKLRVVVRASFAFPPGVSPANACTGSMRIMLKAPRLRSVGRTIPVAWGVRACESTMIANLPRKWNRKKVKASVSFSGNPSTMPATKTANFRLK